jgi:hypothetical protein
MTIASGCLYVSGFAGMAMVSAVWAEAHFGQGRISD